MKAKKMMLYILMFLPLLVGMIALPFLPEQVPAHYGFDNQVTRWGSKYETLIYPVCTILMGFFMLGMARWSAKQEEGGQNNEKVLIIAGIVIMLLFNVMNGFMLYADFKQVENLSSISPDMYQILFGVLGVFMIVVGNVMPKVRMNSVVGLRTPWSMKNETTWKKSQHFGGITFMLAGIATIVICLLTTEMQCLLWSMVVLGVVVIVDVIYSYMVAKKN